MTKRLALLFLISPLVLGVTPPPTGTIATSSSHSSARANASARASGGGGGGGKWNQDIDWNEKRQAPGFAFPECGSVLSTPYGGIGGMNRVCELERLAIVYLAMGDVIMAKAVLLEAHQILTAGLDNWASDTSSWVVRWFLRPIFRLVPWVGKSAY